jgi:MFS family permease
MQDVDASTTGRIEKDASTQHDQPAMTGPVSSRPAADPASARRGFWTVAAVLGLFLTAASAPSPLYGTYAARWHFGPTTITTIFAVYAIALLAVLLTAGSLSDSIGRRPVIVIALLIESASMLLFLLADGVIWLYAARTLQGLATGLVLAAVAAALIDLEPPDRPSLGPLINSIIPTIGLAAGALAAGGLVQYGPAALHLIYSLLLAGFLLLTAATAALPAFGAARAPVSFRPRVSVEPAIRPAFWATLPCLVATWALGGLYLSLGPSLIGELSGSGNLLLGGSIVTALCIAGAVACFCFRAWPAGRTMRTGCLLLLGGLAITIIAVALANSGLLFAGTVVAGAGFGSGFLGAFRSLAARASAEGRAGLIAAIYIASYLAFSLPAIVAGVLTTHLGLRPVTIGYAAVAAALALASLAAAPRGAADSVPREPGRGEPAAAASRAFRSGEAER